MNSTITRAASSVRKRALVVLSASAVLIPLSVWLALTLHQRFTGRGVVILPALLAVPALIALTELASGIPIAELSARWDGLAGWQRGVLGMTIVAAVFAALGGGIVLAAKLGMF